VTVLSLALVAGACAGSEERPAASGALGPVTQADADRAVAGLCDIVGATERAPANAAFQDRAHATLHAVAAAAEEVDRAAAAALLLTKQRVEADLAEPVLPAGFAADVEALLAALDGALEVIGLHTPACDR
jgi:hypothetical protein